MDVFTVPHASLGSVTWHVMSSLPSGEMICIAYLRHSMPFSCAAPSTVEYLRIDYFGASPRLVETEDKSSSVRYADISAYGCNQWPVSSLRRWLNGEFLSGFSPSFVSRLVPQSHTLLLSETLCSDSTVPSSFVSSDGTRVFDEISRPRVRSTFCSCSDLVTVLTRQEANTFRDFLIKHPTPNFTHLMDAYERNTFYVYNLYTYGGNPSVSVGNAGQAVCVCPVIKIKEQ